MKSEGESGFTVVYSNEGCFLRNSLCMPGISDLKTAKNCKMVTEQSANEIVISYKWLQSMMKDYSGGSIMTMCYVT